MSFSAHIYSEVQATSAPVARAMSQRSSLPRPAKERIDTHRQRVKSARKPGPEARSRRHCFQQRCRNGDRGFASDNSTQASPRGAPDEKRSAQVKPSPTRCRDLARLLRGQGTDRCRRLPASSARNSSSLVVRRRAREAPTHSTALRPPCGEVRRDNEVRRIAADCASRIVTKRGGQECGEWMLNNCTRQCDGESSSGDSEKKRPERECDL